MQGGGCGGRRWRVRRPRWLVVEKAALDAQWRDSQRAHRPWASTGTPALDIEDVPAPVKVEIVDK